MESNIPEIGSRISLISKSGIRYEGSLYAVDPDECTIALSSVRSFGTENRNVEDKIPAANHVYEYILFRGSDIKDIQMVEATRLPNDPAIVQSAVQPTSVSSLPKPPTVQQQQQQPLLSSFMNIQQQSFGASLFGNNPNLLHMPHGQVSTSLTASNLFSSATASLSNSTTAATPLSSTNPTAVKSPTKTNEKKTQAAAAVAPKAASVTSGTQNQQRQPYRQQQQPQQKQRPQQRQQWHERQEMPAFDPSYGQQRFGNFTQRHQYQQPRRPNQRSYDMDTNNAFQQSSSTYVNNRNNQQQQQMQQPQQNRPYRNQYQQQNYNQQSEYFWSGWSDGRFRNGGNSNADYIQYRNYRPYQNGPNAIAEMRRMGRQILSSGGAATTAAISHQRAQFNRFPAPNDQANNRNRVQRIQFKEDYDFEKANNEFEELCHKLDSVTLKSTAAKTATVLPNEKNGETSRKHEDGSDAVRAETDAENKTGGSKADEQSINKTVTVTEPVTFYYDKGKSFFDNISCDESDANQKIDRNKEWQLNSETFGLTTNNHRMRENNNNRNRVFIGRSGNGGDNRRNYYGGNVNRYGYGAQNYQQSHYQNYQYGNSPQYYHYNQQYQYQQHHQHQQQPRNQNRMVTATVSSN